MSQPEQEPSLAVRIAIGVGPEDLAAHHLLNICAIPQSKTKLETPGLLHDSTYREWEPPKMESWTEYLKGVCCNQVIPSKAPLLLGTRTAMEGSSRTPLQCPVGFEIAIPFRKLYLGPGKTRQQLLTPNLADLARIEPPACAIQSPQTTDWDLHTDPIFRRYEDR